MKQASRASFPQTTEEEAFAIKSLSSPLDLYSAMQSWPSFS